MTKKEPINVTVEMVIKQVESATPPGTQPTYSYPRWGIFWPGKMQESAFAYVTRDELMRFPGLREVLMKNESKNYPITVTIASKEN